jgi:hypothetical protein
MATHMHKIEGRLIVERGIGEVYQTDLLDVTARTAVFAGF